MTKNKHEADVAFIEALARLLCENDLTEVQVKRDYGDNDSLNVRVSRMAIREAHISAPAASPAPVVPTAPGAPVAPAPPAGDSDDPAQHPGAVTSPMVGTAYLSPEPGTAAFVTIGARVSEGDTLMIVEAMKTMNHIPAPKAGVVRRILVSDGDPVEFGAPLMIVE